MSSQFKAAYRRIKQAILKDRRLKIIPRISFESMANKERLVIILVLLLNVVLVSPTLMPDFYEINPYDEAKYIDSGRSLIEFQLRDLAWGPIVAVLYAPLHLLFKGSLDWFLIEAWAGRFVLFAMLWLSTYYLASKFKDQTHKFVVVGVLFVSLPFFAVIENQSDAVFASFSAVGLAKLISFHRQKNPRDIWVGSVFTGLAVLARVEGLILVGLFVILASILGFRLHSTRKVLALSLLPSLGIIGGFVLLSRIATGSFDYSIGAIGSKAYDSFEWNQSVLTGGDLEEGFRDVEEEFGSREQNQGSVIRAILSNPLNFGRRILANAMKIPDYFLNMFGKKLGPVLLLFTILGVYALIRRGAVPLLLIMLVWSLQSAISLAFLARHLVPQICYIPMILGSIGMAYAFGPHPSRAERTVYLLSTLFLTLYGWIDEKFAFMVSGFILTSILLIAYFFWTQIQATRYPVVIPLLILFGGGLILRGPYPFPNYPSLGDSAEEQAVHFLQNNFPAGSTLAAPAPKYPIAAQMKDLPFSEVPNVGSSQELYNWLSDHQVDAVYMTPDYANVVPSLNFLLEEGVGDYFDVAFTGEPGSIRIFSLLNSSSSN